MPAEVVVGVSERRGRPDYGLSRNCYAPVPGVTHVRMARTPVERVSWGTVRSFLDQLYVPRTVRKTDLLHLMNRVPAIRTSQPWLVTFESYLPRLWGPDRRQGYLDLINSRLLSEECRGIVAMSEFARSVFYKHLPQSIRADLNQKLVVVAPYQQPITGATPVEPPTPIEPLRLIMVGAAFFRKGGEALLRTIEKVGDDLNLHLTIVSRVDNADYAAPHLSEIEIRQVQSRLASSTRVSWHKTLPNRDALDLMRRSHIGVLPSLGESYGYSLLEAMAVGLPVISTNIQAMPEIVTPDVGWTLRLPLDANRYWQGLQRGFAAYEAALDSLTAQLTALLTDVRAGKHDLRAMSQGSLAKTRRTYQEERTAAMCRHYGSAVS